MERDREDCEVGGVEKGERKRLDQDLRVSTVLERGAGVGGRWW